MNVKDGLGQKVQINKRPPLHLVSKQLKFATQDLLRFSLLKMTFNTIPFLGFINEKGLVITNPF